MFKHQKIFLIISLNRNFAGNEPETVNFEDIKE